MMMMIIMMMILKLCHRLDQAQTVDAINGFREIVLAHFADATHGQGAIQAYIIHHHNVEGVKVNISVVVFVVVFLGFFIFVVVVAVLVPCSTCSIVCCCCLAV